MRWLWITISLCLFGPIGGRDPFFQKVLRFYEYPTNMLVNEMNKSYGRPLYWRTTMVSKLLPGITRITGEDTVAPIDEYMFNRRRNHEEMRVGWIRDDCKFVVANMTNFHNKTRRSGPAHVENGAREECRLDRVMVIPILWREKIYNTSVILRTYKDRGQVVKILGHDIRFDDNGEARTTPANMRTFKLRFSKLREYIPDRYDKHLILSKRRVLYSRIAGGYFHWHRGRSQFYALIKTPLQYRLQSLIFNLTDLNPRKGAEFPDIRVYVSGSPLNVFPNKLLNWTEFASIHPITINIDMTYCGNKSKTVHVLDCVQKGAGIFEEDHLKFIPSEYGPRESLVRNTVWRLPYSEELRFVKGGHKVFAVRKDHILLLPYELEDHLHGKMLLTTPGLATRYPPFNPHGGPRGEQSTSGLRSKLLREKRHRPWNLRFQEWFGEEHHVRQDYEEPFNYFLLMFFTAGVFLMRNLYNIARYARSKVLAGRERRRRNQMHQIRAEVARQRRSTAGGKKRSESIPGINGPYFVLGIYPEDEDDSPGVYGALEREPDATVPTVQPTVNAGRDSAEGMATAKMEQTKRGEGQSKLLPKTAATVPTTGGSLEPESKAQATQIDQSKMPVAAPKSKESLVASRPTMPTMPMTQSRKVEQTLPTTFVPVTVAKSALTKAPVKK